jgi:SAM-dependent methyltransferase
MKGNYKVSNIRANNEIQERFGYQWTHFYDIFQEFERHFQRLIYPLTPAHFAGKLVLDAGCGYGRYAL